MINNKNIVIKSVTVNEYKKDFLCFQYSIFISYEWISSIARDNMEVVLLHFYNQDRLIGKIGGIYPLSKIPSHSFLMFYSGIALIQKDEYLYEKCLLELYKYAKKEKYTRFIVSDNDQSFNPNLTIKGLAKKISHDYVYDLKDGIPIEKKMRRYILKNVKKSRKINPTFHCSNSPLILEQLYKLTNQTKQIRYKKYGEDYIPFNIFTFTNKKTFQKLFETGIIEFQYAESSQEIICIFVMLKLGKKVVGLMNATNELGYQNNIHAFMYYNSIKYYQNQNYSSYNILQNSRKDHGLNEFKKALGCEKIEVYRFDSYFLQMPFKLINVLIKIFR